MRFWRGPGRSKRPLRLSQAELQAWLDQSAPRAPAASLAMIDGFLAGLIVGPSFVAPEEWLVHLMGPHQVQVPAGSKAEAVARTILGYYNDINETIADRPSEYTPILERLDTGEVQAEDWANGFDRAVRLRLTHWESVFDNSDSAAPALAVILANCTDPHSCPVWSELPAAAPPQGLEDRYGAIVGAVLRLLRVCGPYRVTEAITAHLNPPG